MKRKISNHNKRNLKFVLLMFLVLLISLNIILAFVNRSFTDKKILEENLEIVDLTTFLIEDNHISVAIEFLEHYKDSHHIEFSIESLDGTMIYSSTTKEITAYVKTISANNVEYIIKIDNTHSITVDILNQNIYSTTVIIIISTTIVFFTLIAWNSKYAVKINRDIESVLTFIEYEKYKNTEFHYHEFELIYNKIIGYTKEIDVLQEQKHLSVSGLAHDIKTPLTIIKSYVNPYDKQSKLVSKEKCIDSINKISRLVEYLIEDDFAGAFYEVDLNILIQKLLLNYVPIFKYKDIDVRYKEKKNTTIRWNFKQCSIVLDNLISNAYYYSNENTVVSIELLVNGNMITIKVSSIGNPIQPENVNSIFEKGFRISNINDNNEDGQGYGLYIVKLLLKQIDATIKVEVNGECNTFIIDIPFK